MAINIIAIDIAVQYQAPPVPFPTYKEGPIKIKGNDHASLNRPETSVSWLVFFPIGYRIYGSSHTPMFK